MNYNEIARKLRAKADDKAVTEEERAILLAKASELEAKYRTGVFTFTIRMPTTKPQTYWDNWLDSILETEDWGSSW